jgi:hypothetical protein
MNQQSQVAGSDEPTDSQRWVERVKLELGLELHVDNGVILDLAREAAHAVERPAAPITTFLLGYAIGRGADLDDCVAKISGLAANWPAS